MSQSCTDFQLSTTEAVEELPLQRLHQFFSQQVLAVGRFASVMKTVQFKHNVIGISYL
jgi:hypothetical protein